MKMAMSNLSNFGIKMVLPLVLVALDKNDWRTKVQSAQMLGSMAYCAPKVLATYLPQIIPKLNNVLQDPKKDVTTAATAALKNIGSVVRNPEIASLVPLLIESITKGGEHTKKALNALINTSFTNVVDVPSLALVIPILTNAMSDRSSSTKKMAAQVIGGICSLIAEPKSILPYLSELLNGIKSILIDPIPEVRSASALAIRSLNESLPDNVEQIEAVYFWLMTLLNDETSNNVQRFGAAQGLSELLASYHSDDKISECLPVILEGLNAKNPCVRESFCQVFVYLPKALSSDFPYWMEQIIPPLLSKLGDDKEAVRSVTLKGLKIMVYMFHLTEFDLLLELLEEGLEFIDYRVRDSTLILIGDLLNGLAGNEGSVSYETTATSQSEQRILEYLGSERRNEVFSVLYMARSDCEQPVRSRANITWKGLVYNSSKMLKAILDTLMHALITSLSSSNRDRQEAASKSLGDLVKNAGQFILPKIVPILRRGLQQKEGDDSYKEGIALGLAQVLQNAHPRLIEKYQSEVVDSISLGICDSLLRVRSASGTAFNIAVKVFGKSVINKIVPSLVASLHIDGIKQLLISSNEKVSETLILPYLIQELLMKNHELRAISLLAKDINEHCYGYLHKYIADIFKSICSAVAQSENFELLQFGNKIIIDGVPEECTHLLLTTCMEFIQMSKLSVSDNERLVALSLLSAFVKHTKNSFEDNLSQIIGGTLQLFVDENEAIRAAAWNSLKDIMASIDDEDVAQHIDWLRQCIRNISENGKISLIAGFNISRGLQPVMKMFDFGIRNGSFEERASAAKLMSDLINLTEIDAVKPFLNKICGALIRICADRFPQSVKCAILQCLTLLIRKYGPLMKGFYTPLQTTFVKVIRDPSRDVRSDASSAILELMKYSPKFDNLLRELNNYLKKQQEEEDAQQSSNKDVTVSILTTMRAVLMLIGPKIKPSVLDDISNTFQVSDAFRSERDDNLRFSASQCVAAVIHCIASSEERDEMIVSLLDIDDDDDDWRSIEYDLNSLAFVIFDCSVYGESLHSAYHDDIEQTFLSFLASSSQQVLVQIAALRIGYNLVSRMANFSFLSLSHRKTQIINLLDKHLLPLLSPKVNNNNEDIVISSCEFLLDGILFKDGEEEKEKESEIWTLPEVHQVIVPYLVQNHLNRIQPELMRKCITTLLKIETTQKYYDEFVKICNQKNVGKELKTIVDALQKVKNNQ